MSTLYENIMRLCAERGVSGSKMCIDCSISKSTLSSLKAGRTKKVSMENAQKIAAYFEIPLGQLMGADDGSTALDIAAASVSGQKEKATIDLVDDDLREYLDELRNRPEQRLLFSVTKNATKAQIEAIVKMIEEMQGNR